MKKNYLNVFIITILLGVLLTSCTSGAASASSWAGFAISNGNGYFSYGNQVYALEIKNGSLLWKYPAGGSSSRQFYAAPEVGTNLIVVGDYSKTLAALDKQSGAEKWQFTGASDRYIGSALNANSMVYAPNTDGYLYALDENGNLVWRFKAAGPNWTKPVADSQYVYLASMGHSVYALNLNYSQSMLSPDKNGKTTLVSDPVWAVDLGAAIVSDPVLADGVLYVGTVDGNLYAIDTTSKSIKWSFNGDGKMTAIWGRPVLVDNTIYFGDEAGSIYALNIANGQPLWTAPFDAGSSMVSGGVAANGKVIFASKAGKIFMIDDSKDPQTLATLDTTIYSPLGFDGDKIIVAPAMKDKLFMALNMAGNEIWSYYPAK